MSKFRLGRSIEVGRVTLNIAINYGGDEGRGEVGMIAIVGARYDVDKGGEVGGQNCIS